MGIPPDVSRRDLFKGVAGTSVSALLRPGNGWGQEQHGIVDDAGALALPVLAQPDLVMAYVGEVNGEPYGLDRSGEVWTGRGDAAGVLVGVVAEERQSTVSLESATAPVQRIHLRWRREFSPGTLALGDAWERSYGDLEWRFLEAERAMPWYVMLHLRERTAGMGVKTGAASFAFWQVDSAGVSLWLDVRNGSNGVRLGAARLDAATIVTCVGVAGESAFSTTRRLCRRMAEGTDIPLKRGVTAVDAIFGSNDWYYAYGNNTSDGILRDADLVRSLAPTGGPKPFTVVDDGYQDRSRFPDLAKLAAEIRKRDVLPGVWIRPMRAAAGTPRTLLLPDARWRGDDSELAPLAYDPTIPEALEAITRVVTEACGWGFDLIKHDFTTFELFGQWGSQMGASPAQGNWHFRDRSLTNAQIVTMLYRQIRLSCGDERVILGCNTIGHLSVGLFDASRTGDDVSGRQWERTRRIGVNTLAFRLPQHRSFFAVDADCVPLTREVPWSMSRQWLEAIASTGTVLLISPEPGAVGPEQREAVRGAFARCVQRSETEPLDWLSARTPSAWRSDAGVQRYDWVLAGGESPFPIGIQRGAE